MTESRHKNFLNFIRFCSLNLIFMDLFAEFRMPGKAYGIFSLLNIIRAKVLNIPYVPYMSVEFASFGWFPIFIQFFYVAAFIVVIVKTESRWSYILAVLALLAKNTTSQMAVGVHSASIYFIPFLILLIEPPKNDNTDKVRQRVIMAFAMMYFFSAIPKLNEFYLAGLRAQYDGLLRFTTEPFFNEQLYKIVSWVGIVLELVASLLIFFSSRRLALLAVLIFHTSASSLIILSIPLVFFGCSLLLLFDAEKERTPYFRFLVMLAFLFPLLMQLNSFLGIRFYPNLQGTFHDIISMSLAVFAFVVAVKLLKNMPLEKKTYFSWIGFLLPVIYVVLGWTFDWHEPFSYFQYSGKATRFSGLVLPYEKVKKYKHMEPFPRRWSSRAYTDLKNGEVVIIFPSKVYADKLLEYFCKLEPTASYKRISSKERAYMEPSMKEFNKSLEYSEWTPCVQGTSF